MPNDFPPLLSPAEFAGNLPQPPTPIVGREQEVAHLTRLLIADSARLVTLTGPGGTGKTRLCLEVGHTLRDRFPHGVFFVDLAPITDPALVASTIAHAMGIREGGGRPAFDNLREYLADKRVLLLLDNLEQVVSAAPVVAGLLAATRHVNLLATSRIPLQIRGEREYPVDTPVSYTHLDRLNDDLQGHPDRYLTASGSRSRATRSLATGRRLGRLVPPRQR